MANFTFSLQLSERHFIDLPKPLNFILIVGIVCQEPGVIHGHTSVNCNVIKKVHFHLIKHNYVLIIM